MAKRPSPRVTASKATKTAAKTARPAAKGAKASRPPKPPARKPAAPVAARKNPAPAAKAPVASARKPPAAPAPGLADHLVGVELFEKGFRLLQQRKFREAAEMFNSVVVEHPDEKELIERARVYIAVCKRQATPPDATPKTFEERLYAATLSVNRGAYDDGLAQLTALEREQPDHDHIQYLLAVVRTQRGETDAALAHLQKAIDLKPSLRLQAGTDIDLEPLHDTPGFEELLAAAAARPRPAPRERTGR